ncbi:MAG: AEC family transporter [Lachnospiraceae bacterium]|nr:AEC family transporter [Lachnospiraceae bacterium]
MELSSLLNLQGELFLLLVVGAVLRKKKILPETAKDILTDLILYLVLPCNIIHSFRIEFNMEILKSAFVILMVSVLIQFLCMGLSRTLYNKEESGRKKVFQYATLVSNAGFMGNPIAEGVFGAQGLMYASIYLVPLRIVMWSAGIACFTESNSTREVIKKVVTHPCIVAVYIGLVLMIGQLPLPEFLGMTIQTVGACTTPLSMILIGTIFADMELAGMISKPVLRYTFVRLAVIPGIAFVGCRLFGIDRLITGVSVLLAAMPAGSTTAILANKYQGDVVFATKCVVFSTLMTLVTVPLWCLVL